MKKNKNRSFESSIKELEDIVDKIDSGETDLEDSVFLYEKGVELKNYCKKKLEDVELKIKKIKLEDGKIKKEDYIDKK